MAGAGTTMLCPYVLGQGPDLPVAQAFQPVLPQAHFRWHRLESLCL